MKTGIGLSQGSVYLSQVFVPGKAGNCFVNEPIQKSHPGGRHLALTVS